LATFAMTYSVPVEPVEHLVADTGGFSIRYRVDDETQLLTVYENPALLNRYLSRRSSDPACQ
jgi:hypothetical protein